MNRSSFKDARAMIAGTAPTMLIRSFFLMSAFVLPTSLQFAVADTTIIIATSLASSCGEGNEYFNTLIDCRCR